MNNNKSLLLVINPKSGKGFAKRRIFDIISILSYKGFEVTVYPTKRQGTAQYVAQYINKYDRVVACGGDGTLSDVIAGAVYSGSKTPIGLIPMGSTNDFARNIRIPKSTLLATLIAAGNTYIDYDIGRINGKPFVYIAAVGAFTEVSYAAPQDLKNAFGHFAYVLEGAKSLSSIKPIKMDITFNDKHLVDKFLYASVSNTFSVGGILTLDRKSINLNDGIFELLLIRQPNRNSETLELISDLAANNMQSKFIDLYSVNNVSMRFDSPVYFSLDGEKSDLYRDINIHNCKGEVRFIVPNKFYELTNATTKFQT